MKTKEEVIRENPEYKELINDVMGKIGIDDVRDIIEHGIDGGYPGFTYLDETNEFFKKHKKAILKMAKDYADSLGEDVIKMIGSFNCLKWYDYSTPDGREIIAKTVYGRKTDEQIANALAWFAGEEVCRMFEDE